MFGTTKVSLNSILTSAHHITQVTPVGRDISRSWAGTCCLLLVSLPLQMRLVCLEYHTMIKYQQHLPTAHHRTDTADLAYLTIIRLLLVALVIFPPIALLWWLSLLLNVVLYYLSLLGCVHCSISLLSSLLLLLLIIVISWYSEWIVRIRLGGRRIRHCCSCYSVRRWHVRLISLLLLLLIWWCLVIASRLLLLLLLSRVSDLLLVRSLWIAILLMSIPYSILLLWRLLLWWLLLRQLLLGGSLGTVVSVGTRIPWRVGIGIIAIPIIVKKWVGRHLVSSPTLKQQNNVLSNKRTSHAWTYENIFTHYIKYTL